MTERKDIAARLSEQLAEVCEGLSPLESALLIADAMREAFPNEEVTIEAKADGSFAVVNNK